MKKLFLSILAVLVISVASISAQNKKAPEKMKANGWMKELNLTTDQQSKIKTLNEDLKVKLKDLRSQERELTKAHKAEVETILTPEQQSKLKDLRKEKIKEWKKDGKKMAHKNKNGKRDKFDATTESKLQALRDNFKKEKKAIEMSRIAPEEQAKRQEDLLTKFREDRRQIVKEARQQTKAEQQNS